jgi:N-acetylglutamate synthase-like GNAT family acetyltransferase
MALPAGVTVRRARPGDASPVFALVEQLGYAPDHRGFDETFAQVVRHPEAAVFVAQEGLRVIGYLALSHRPQIRLGGRAAYIDELVIDERRRGEGLGTALLEAALAHARGLGCRRVDLVTNRARSSYQRGFYVGHGFKEVDSALLRFELVTRK